jgi:hypothetical protein
MGTLGSSTQIKIDRFLTIVTKVEGLNKEQKALEKASDKFIINNKMCSTEFKSIAKNTKESTNSDLRRKVDDPQLQVRKSKPAQKGTTEKAITRKPREPAEIDEDGFILVTGKNAARRPQKQAQQTARAQPTTQYEVLSSNEDNEEEESESEEERKSDEDEESLSKEEDNNKKKAPKARQLTRELRALDISQENDEPSEEPKPSRSETTRELRSLGTTPQAEESTTIATSSNKEESPGAIH